MNVIKLCRGVVAAVTLLCAASWAQASIVYTVDRVVGAGTVTGFFETDGTIGALTSANFLDWSLTIQHADINGGAATTSSLAGGASLFDNGGGGVSATATDILFNFSGSGALWTYTTTNDFWCVAGSVFGCFVENAEVIGYSEGAFAAADSVSYQGVQSLASVAVPEPGTLALLGLGLAGLAATRRRKQ